MSFARPSGAIRASLDEHGHIVSADAPILRLQEAAGGEPTGKLLVPQLATVVRLAQRLRILVARPVLAACEGTSISMWVRARSHAHGVDLDISDWRETLVAVPGQTGLQRAADIALAADGWSWRTDAQLCFIDVADAPASERPAIGATFSSVFRLETTGEGAHSVLAAIVQRRSFFGELVGSGMLEGRAYSLSGHPMFAGGQEFLGYRGKAALLDAVPENMADVVQEAPVGLHVLLPDISKRLDVALRQPLGRIIANAETISGQLEGPLRPDYAGYGADIANAGRHLMELVDDLADLQAIDRPNFKVAQEDVDLADIARRTAGLLGLKAADKQIRIVAPASNETMPAIGEFRRALQIAVNLVGNAVRYGPEDSVIWLRVSDDDGMATLIVADQGHGIAPEDQERIFEKFERLGREDSIGSGLGLYISRRLARAMGGDIRIDSAPGQGARFILSLPKKN